MADISNNDIIQAWNNASQEAIEQHARNMHVPQFLIVHARKE